MGGSAERERAVEGFCFSAAFTECCHGELLINTCEQKFQVLRTEAFCLVRVGIMGSTWYQFDLSITHLPEGFLRYQA